MRSEKNSAHPAVGTRPRWQIVRLVVLCATLSLTACGSHTAKVALPSSTPPAAPSESLPVTSASGSPRAPQDAVTAAYLAFLAAANRAIVAPPDQARPIIQPYATGDFLSFQVQQVSVHQRAHEEPWGRAVPHLTKVDIDGAAATVHDCQDDSHAGLADRRTHKLIATSRGTADQNLVADMTRGSDGRWKVAGLRLDRAPCHEA